MARPRGELNGFPRSRWVLSVDRRWVEEGSSSFWSFCVNYLEASSAATGDGRQSVQRGKVDYKEVLSPEEFAVFARLREVRMEIAAAEAVPVNTVFFQQATGADGAGESGQPGRPGQNCRRGRRPHRQVRDADAGSTGSGMDGTQG